MAVSYGLAARIFVLPSLDIPRPFGAPPWKGDRVVVLVRVAMVFAERCASGEVGGAVPGWGMGAVSCDRDSSVKSNVQMPAAKRYSASRLRSDLYRALDEVLETGEPLEIERRGRLLRIVPAEHVDRLARLRPHPEAMRGDLESLVHVDWSDAWTP